MSVKIAAVIAEDSTRKVFSPSFSFMYRLLDGIVS
jgi:hypothetical protein